ncbi:hypothetical protein [Chryseolinea serpens]|nr:hypothetical protein [Chryseolinea serpens]
MKFNFDNKGQVVSRTEYNREGNPSLYEFDRNSSGNIVKQTFTYLDSLEQKNTSFSSEITDYTYDSKNRLVKSKERDGKGNALADEQSDYSAFAYDSKDRLVKEIRQYYDPGAGHENSVYTTTFKYVDDKLTGQSQTYENKRLFLTTKLKYNRTWKLLRVDDYNNLTNRPSTKTIYQYDAMDRLVYYATSGSFSECPDGGTYNEAYEYDDKGLLLRITHSYGDKRCVMTFEYH